MDDLNFVDKSDFLFHHVSGKVTLKDDYYAFLNEEAIAKQVESLEAKSLLKNGYFAFSYNAIAQNPALIQGLKKKGFEVDIALGNLRISPPASACG